MADAITAVGCHIYAGGFAIGAMRAGLNVLCHYEDWNFGIRSCERNLGINIVRDKREFTGLHPRVVYANPPCAGWSLLSTKGKKGAIKSAFGWSSTMELLQMLSPDVFIGESVIGTLKDAAFINLLMTTLPNHCLTIVTLNVADLGLPQNRIRTFFFLSRFHLNIGFKPLQHISCQQALATVNDWDKRTAVFSERHFRAACLAKPGEKLRKYYSKIGFAHHLINPFKPAPTLTGPDKWIPTSPPRLLTVGETAILCGWPEGFEFVDNINKSYKQACSAVTPPAALWACSIARSAIVAGQPARPGVKFIDLRKRSPIPLFEEREPNALIL